MDTWEGNDEEPLSLHKYLYASGNPVNRVDPGGNEDFDMASIGVSESMSTTLYAMAQLQPSHLTSKLGIGLEVNDPAAYANGVLNLAKDTGHTFVYARDVTGTVTSILSFGPIRPIGGLDRVRFLSGNLPGSAHWTLDGNAKPSKSA